MTTILVVDDEPHVVRFLSRCLSAQGYSVASAPGGREALAHLGRHPVDLVLLDVMMPGCSGMQVLAELRTWATPPPVIVLSAVGEVGTRIQALEYGAVDFVQKPFNVAELVARIRCRLAQVVRVPQQQRQDEDGARYLSAAGLRLDLDRRHVTGDGVDVVLTERELALLAHLMRRQDRVCSKEELWHDVWGLPFDPGSNIVEVCVGRLRNKLGDAPIETIRGVGYCLVGSRRVRAS